MRRAEFDAPDEHGWRSMTTVAMITVAKTAMIIRRSQLENVAR